MATNIEMSQTAVQSEHLAVRRIGVADLRAALAAGWRDFSANRTDVMFLAIIYPVVGLALFRVALGYDVLPLLFPLAAGFALLGPFAAIGLYELSRRRELGLDSTWRNAFDVLHARSLGAILLLGLVLTALFVVWLQAAEAIYTLCLGAAAPASLGSFASDVLTTRQGWMLIVLGNAVGLGFAVVAFTLSVISFPMLIDREIAPTTSAQVSVAVHASVRAVLANPLPMAAWGLIVAALLALGSLPCFIGLAVVMPVLGHASWHLYRRVIAR